MTWESWICEQMGFWTPLLDRASCLVPQQPAAAVAQRGALAVVGRLQLLAHSLAEVRRAMRAAAGSSQLPAQTGSALSKEARTGPTKHMGKASHSGLPSWCR